MPALLDVARHLSYLVRRDEASAGAGLRQLVLLEEASLRAALSLVQRPAQLQTSLPQEGQKPAQACRQGAATPPAADALSPAPCATTSSPFSASPCGFSPTAAASPSRPEVSPVTTSTSTYSSYSSSPSVPTSRTVQPKHATSSLVVLADCLLSAADTMDHVLKLPVASTRGDSGTSSSTSGSFAGSSAPLDTTELLSPDLLVLAGQAAAVLTVEVAAGRAGAEMSRHMAVAAAAATNLQTRVLAAMQVCSGVRAARGLLQGCC